MSRMMDRGETLTAIAEVAGVKLSEARAARNQAVDSRARRRTREAARRMRHAAPDSRGRGLLAMCPSCSEARSVRFGRLLPPVWVRLAVVTPRCSRIPSSDDGLLAVCSASRDECAVGRPIAARLLQTQPGWPTDCTCRGRRNC